MKQKTWIDGIISSLSSQGSGGKKDKEQLVDYLKFDLKKSWKIFLMLKAEGSRIAYPHITVEINELAKRKERQARIIKNLILEMGVDTIDDLMDHEALYARGNFQMILDEESNLLGYLSDHANSAEDSGFFGAAEKLRAIKQQNYELIEKLERIIMRINTEV